MVEGQLPGSPGEAIGGGEQHPAGAHGDVLFAVVNDLDQAIVGHEIGSADPAPEGLPLGGKAAREQERQQQKDRQESGPPNAAHGDTSSLV